jgi:hypothetical protein
MRRLLYGAVATFLTLAVGVSSCVAVRSRDLADPGDADLLPERGELRPEEDGYLALRRTIDELSYPVEDEELLRQVKRVLRGEEGLDDRLSAILDANQAAFTHVRDVLGAKRIRIPEGEPFDRLIPWSGLVRLLALEAHRHAQRGRAQRSLRAHLDAIELGHRLATAEGAALIHAMSGLSMENIASESLRGSLARMDITADDARRTAHALAAYHSSPDGWSRMWAQEYRKTRNMILTLNETAPSGPGISLNPVSWFPASYTFQSNRTLGSYSRMYRTKQRMSALPCAQIPGLPDLGAWDALRMILDHNGVGDYLLRLTEPNLRRFEERRCLADTSLAATQAFLGLRAYLLEHGDLPDDLGALVPRYLESLPRDGFDDAPLRYSRSSRWLHSPGSDRIDHGGDPEQREGDELMREPTYRIPF